MDLITTMRLCTVREHARLSGLAREYFCFNYLCSVLLFTHRAMAGMHIGVLPFALIKLTTTHGERKMCSTFM